jgi:hypothetical protein
MVWFSQQPEDRPNERKTSVDRIKQSLGPVITVTQLTWGSEDPVPMVEGVLVVQTETAEENGNGWPTYRVTAPLVRLVHWLGEHYVGLSKSDAHDLADIFVDAEFTKVTTAFGE